MLFWGEQPPLTPFGCAGRQFFDHKTRMKDKTAPRDRTNGAVLDPLSGDPRGRGGRTGHGALGAWGSWRRDYREVICRPVAGFRPPKINQTGNVIKNLSLLVKHNRHEREPQIPVRKTQPAFHPDPQ